ncbi:MAG: hypothetical protein K0R00_3184 [Herbinix sp.]|jgi:hypothetical protein|nr:hypothetical protein [Herbinix sp.]
MNDLINRKAIAEEIKSLEVSITGLRAGKGILQLYAEEYKKSVLKIIDEQPIVQNQICDIGCGLCLAHNSLKCPRMEVEHE